MKELIDKFYTAFAQPGRRDNGIMLSRSDIVFHDPAFGEVGRPKSW